MVPTQICDECGKEFEVVDDEILCKDCGKDWEAYEDEDEDENVEFDDI
jgi:predicted  nucleic acid-binding Zn-ribbon protein